MFGAKRNPSEQVANFTAVNVVVKAQVGTECDPFVLESLEREIESGPEEPLPVTIKDGLVAKTEEMKCKSEYDTYLTWVHKVELQLKQAYSKYYVHSGEETKGLLTKDPEFERTQQEKDVLKLRKLLKNNNFNYKQNK